MEKTFVDHSVFATILWEELLKANGSRPDAARTVLTTRASLTKALDQTLFRLENPGAPNEENK